ncbi:MAG: hypothetical protein J6A22_01990 [Bacteroidales bacterium]|nr:hypothetical protein [Bacteroidales bacterium]
MMKTKTIEISSGVSYVTPEVFVVDIRNEGVLCQSGSFEKWNEDNDFQWE